MVHHSPQHCGILKFVCIQIQAPASPVITIADCSLHPPRDTCQGPQIFVSKEKIQARFRTVPVAGRLQSSPATERPWLLDSQSSVVCDGHARTSQASDPRTHHKTHRRCWVLLLGCAPTSAQPWPLDGQMYHACDEQAHANQASKPESYRESHGRC